jgi:predicted ATP-grasp superfamily ATP-dependent carboligase
VKQPLAIVGASTRSAAASAVRAGFQALAADLFADADLRRIATATRISPYPAGFADWLRAVEPPAWMYTGALENYHELVEQMAWIAPLWGNSGDVLTRVRSPWELSQTLADAGLLFPEIHPSADDLPRDGSWLMKTYQGASGSGVRVLEEKGRQADKETRKQSEVDTAQESPCLPLSLSPFLVYQRRMVGTACAAIFVAGDDGATLLGVTRQLIGESWLGAHGFQYAGSIGPWPISDVVRATLVKLGKVLADEFELLGLFGVDFILDGDDVWTLEVNPRYTASVEIVERFTGMSAIANHAAACGGATNHVQRTSPIPFCGKATLFAKREMIISQEFADWSLAESARKPWPTLADVSPAGTLVEEGRPILTIFAEDLDVGMVEKQLRERSVEIEKRI